MDESFKDKWAVTQTTIGNGGSQIIEARKTQVGGDASPDVTPIRPMKLSYNL